MPKPPLTERELASLREEFVGIIDRMEREARTHVTPKHLWGQRLFRDLSDKDHAKAWGWLLRLSRQDPKAAEEVAKLMMTADPGTVASKPRYFARNFPWGVDDVTGEFDKDVWLEQRKASEARARSIGSRRGTISRTQRQAWKRGILGVDRLPRTLSRFRDRSVTRPSPTLGRPVEFRMKQKNKKQPPKKQIKTRRFRSIHAASRAAGTAYFAPDAHYGTLGPPSLGETSRWGGRYRTARPSPLNPKSVDPEFRSTINANPRMTEPLVYRDIHPGHPSHIPPAAARPRTHGTVSQGLPGRPPMMPVRPAATLPTAGARKMPRAKPKNLSFLLGVRNNPMMRKMGIYGLLATVGLSLAAAAAGDE